MAHLPLCYRNTTNPIQAVRVNALSRVAISSGIPILEFQAGSTKTASWCVRMFVYLRVAVGSAHGIRLTGLSESTLLAARAKQFTRNFPF